MQTHENTNKNSRSQEIRTLDMQAKQTQTQLNTSWNIQKLADLASLNSCSANLNLKEALQNNYNSNVLHPRLI